MKATLLEAIANRGSGLSLPVAPSKSQPLVGATTVQGTIVAGGCGGGDGLHQLNNPTAVYMAPDDTLYIADSCNRRVVKWSPGSTSGIVVAGGHGPGGASYQLDRPVSITIDDADAMYVCEVGASRVRRGPVICESAWW